MKKINEMIDPKLFALNLAIMGKVVCYAFTEIEETYDSPRKQAIRCDTDRLKTALAANDTIEKITMNAGSGHPAQPALENMNRLLYIFDSAIKACMKKNNFTSDDKLVENINANQDSQHFLRMLGIAIAKVNDMMEHGRVPYLSEHENELATGGIEPKRLLNIAKQFDTSQLEKQHYAVYEKVFTIDLAAEELL